MADSKGALRGTASVEGKGAPVSETHSVPQGQHPLSLQNSSENSKSRKPILLALLDLAQDLDVLLPVLVSAQRGGVFSLRVCITDWLIEHAPRTYHILEQAGLRPELLSRADVRNGITPQLHGVSAVLTASETNQGPHRTGHALARKAKVKDVPTFTVQHGFENIGLTYRDALIKNVSFASESIFTWFPPSILPRWVSAYTFLKLIPVGSPKSNPRTTDVVLPASTTWSRRIGVFENLHWRRFDGKYKRRFLADLDCASSEFPDILFLLKAHNAGQWSVRNSNLITKRSNILLIDPTQPEWRMFTAPALLPALDAVITTPSTVAVDAVQAERPLAVAGYDLDLSLYAPLPVLTSFQDWRRFIEELNSKAWIKRNELFFKRHFLPSFGASKIVDEIAARVRL